MSTLHRNGKNNPNAIQIFCLTISNLPSDEWQAKTVALKQLIHTISQTVNPHSADVEIDDDCSVMSEDSRSVFVLKNMENALISPRKSKLTTRHQSNRVLLPPSFRASPDEKLKRSSSIGSLLSMASEVTGCSVSVAGVPHKIPKSESMLQTQSLRQLHAPFRTMLTDLRALVVKSACYNIAKLIRLVGDNARLLMADMLPDLLALHAQTVKVMHGYAMQAMSSVIHHCKFRGGIAILLREGKGNKSKDVRCVCIKYLHQILDCWPQQFLAPNIETIGQSLVQSLVDPCQSVRMEGRKTFLHSYFRNYPDSWYKIVHAPTGVLANDARLKKSILANSVALAADNKGTIASNLFAVSDNISSVKNDRNYGNAGSSTVAAAGHSKQVDSISSSAFPSNPFRHVAHHTPMDRKLNASARRRVIQNELRDKAACAIQAVVRGTSTRKKVARNIRLSNENGHSSNIDNDVFLSSRIAQDASSPARDAPKLQTEVSPLASPDVAPNKYGYKSLIPRSYSINPQPLLVKSYNNRNHQPADTAAASSTRIPVPKSASNLLNPQVESSYAETSLLALSVSSSIEKKENILSLDDDNNDSRYSLLASPTTPNENKNRNPPPQNNTSNIIKKKRRESSIILQQTLDQQDNDQMLNISHSILSLHRKHMSDLMDALREEMDLISIFESSLLEDSKPQNRVKNGSNTNRLNEEQVLQYYEKVLHCLDERNIMINILKQKMEQLSHS